MKENTKNYWKDRVVQYNPFSSRFKSISLISWLFSVRSSDEAYISKTLNGSEIVIDVSCGAGKSILVRKSRLVVGVDIEGYPSDIAKKEGILILFHILMMGTYPQRKHLMLLLSSI